MKYFLFSATLRPQEQIVARFFADKDGVVTANVYDYNGVGNKMGKARMYLRDLVIVDLSGRKTVIPKSILLKRVVYSYSADKHSDFQAFVKICVNRFWRSLPCCSSLW